MKVAAKTIIGNLAGAMVAENGKGEEVELCCIGAQPVHNAIKAIGNASTMVAAKGKIVLASAQFADITISEDDIKKGIVFKVFFDDGEKIKQVNNPVPRKIIPVTKDENIHILADKIADSFKEGFPVSLLGMGANVFNRAVKAVIISSKYFSSRGERVVFYVSEREKRINNEPLKFTCMDLIAIPYV